MQLALCAGSPDTRELRDEITAAVTALQESRQGVVWIQQMLPRPELLQLLTAADVFICPSIYEPQGIVNLEAMACQVPVVASLGSSGAGPRPAWASASMRARSARSFSARACSRS